MGFRKIFAKELEKYGLLEHATFVEDSPKMWVVDSPAGPICFSRNDDEVGGKFTAYMYASMFGVDVSAKNNDSAALMRLMIGYAQMYADPDWRIENSLHGAELLDAVD